MHDHNMCAANETIAIKACFVPSSVTWCEVGTSCSLTGDSFQSECGFTGVTDQFLSKLIPMTFKCFNLTKSCIRSGYNARRDGCDIAFGTQIEEPSNYWMYNGIYNTDAVSVLQRANVGYSPWDFLRPFSIPLWLSILFVMFILTPLVMSFVEYDEGETIVGNFVRFLPDSVHAHTGTDILNNDLPSKNTSYILSVFVGTFAFITISLYASNLTAFVLYKSTAVGKLSTGVGNRIFIESSIYGDIKVRDAIPVLYHSIPTLHKTGVFDYIIAENYLLRNVQKCDDVLIPFKGFGVSKYIYIARKLGETAVNLLRDNTKGLDAVIDDRVIGCGETPRPVTISNMYGVFSLFLVPVFLITVKLIICRARRVPCVMSG